MSIKNANLLFRNGDLAGALELYRDLQKSMPSLAYILDASIARCNRALGVNVMPSDVGLPSDEGLTRVRFFPDYTSSNPYQKLLYSDDFPHVEVMPGNIEDAEADLRSGAFDVSVFHLHWISHVLSGCTEEGDAAYRVNSFLQQLNMYCEAGGRVVWTIHNVIEHDCVFLEEELRLRQGICDYSWRVHLHSDLALDEINQHYKIPRHKIVVAPHGSYVGYYPDFISRENARALLGIGKDEIVFLSLGMIRPYKGLETLLRAFSEVRKLHPRARLIIAGKVVYPYHPDQIESIVRAYPGVTLFAREIPDVELQYYFRAADTCVLTYNKILTSGSLYLALTFGQSIIGPDMPAISELISKDLGLLYDPENSVVSLTAALKKFVGMPSAKRARLRENASREILRHDWRGTVSALFGGPQNVQGNPRLTQTRFDIELRNVSCDVYSEPCSHEKIEVAVLILNYNSSDDVQELLLSLHKIKDIALTIVLIDNCSPNESLHSLIKRFPDCNIIRTPENIGYAAGNNVGVRFAQSLGAKYIWILNPDTVVEKDTLKELIKGDSDDPDTAIWGSLIAYYDRPEVLWFGGGFININARCEIGHMYHEKPIDAAPTEPYAVDYVTGASIFCRTEVFERAGLIPEHYFLYFEETDWCTRARQRGLKIKVNPASLLLHKKRSQNGAMPTKYYFYYFVRGAMLFRLRYARSDVEKAKKEVLDSFVLPWLKKIKMVGESEHAFFAELANKAIQDGASGRSGRQDLLRLLGDAKWANVPSNELIQGKCEMQPGNVLTGWVINRAHPNERLGVSVCIDGKKTGTAIVSLREDHKLLDNSGSHFHYLIPDELVDDRTHLIEVTSEGTTFCRMTEVFSRGKERLTGRIDGLQDRFVRGWCLDEGNPQRRLIVRIFEGERLVAEGFNDVSRPDVSRAGFKSHVVGFSLPVPLEFCNGNEHKLELRVGDVHVRSRTVAMDLAKFPLAPRDVNLHQLQGWLYARREISFVHPSNRELSALSEMQELRTSFVVEARTKSQDTKVSIIMPLYNREAIVQRALMSVVKQEYKNWELIICDDGSTDRSVEVVRGFIADYGLTEKTEIICLPRNRGVSFARNACLERAKGELISYLDSDNIWDPEFLSVMVNAMRNLGDRSSAYCGDRIVQYYGDSHPAEIVGLRFGPVNRTLIGNKNYIDLNVFVHTRELYLNLGGFREDMRRLVDWELMLRYLGCGTIRSVPVVLATYNLDACANQITRTADYNQNADLIKSTAEKIWADDAISGIGNPEDTGVAVVLLGTSSQQFYRDLVAQAWISSAGCCEVSVSEIDAVVDLPLGLERRAEIADLLNVCLDSGKDLVLAARNSVPRQSWLSNCRKICEEISGSGAVISARYVVGKSMELHPDAIYKNSRRDFRYDVAPLYFVAGAQDHSSDCVQIERLYCGNVYIPNANVSLLLTVLADDRGSFNSVLESYSLALHEMGKGAVYSPRFAVMES